MNAASQQPHPLRMAAAARRRTMRGFTIALFVSLLVHGAGLGSAVYASRKRPAPKLESAIPVQLVKLGKKRDPKLLPRLVAEPPPPPEDVVKLDTSDKSVPIPKEKDKTPRSKEPELSDAARRMLDQSRLDRALEKIDPEGDPEGDEFGTTTDAANAATGYLRDITRALQASYRLPEAIPSSQRQFLRARVVLYIERDGRIREFDFVERHPNGLFMSALETLLKSIVLPKPPPTEAGRVDSDGIEVIFRP